MRRVIRRLQIRVLRYISKTRRNAGTVDILQCCHVIFLLVYNTSASRPLVYNALLHIVRFYGKLYFSDFF